MENTPGHKKIPSPIIIGGCPRSGTTLLRLILDSHRNIACGPEMKIAPRLADTMMQTWRLFGKDLEQNYGLTLQNFARTYGGQYTALLEPYRKKSGKPRIAEKTPQNVLSFPELSLMLPASPFVHVIRDGRDVAASLLRQRWINPRTKQKSPFTQNIKNAAAHWMHCVRTGRKISVLTDRYTEIIYERLVDQPEETLRALFDRLKEPWDPAVLEHSKQPHRLSAKEQVSHGDSIIQPIYTTATGRWQDWSETERSEFKAAAGDLLIELGYATDDRW